jgi:hypothetical protein
VKHDHLQCQRTVMDAVEIFYEGVAVVSDQARLSLACPPPAVPTARGGGSTRAWKERVRRNEALIEALKPVKPPPTPHGIHALNGTKCRFGMIVYRETKRHGKKARSIRLQNAVAHASAAVERVKTWLLITTPDEKVEVSLRLWIARVEQDCTRVTD